MVQPLLDVLWLLVSLALAGAFLRRSAGHGAGRRGRWQRVWALASVMVLLFPIISMSDDLYHEQFRLIEIQSKVDGKNIEANASDRTAVDSPQAPAVLLASAQTPLWAAQGVLVVEGQCATSLPPPLHLAGRAPPYSL